MPAIKYPREFEILTQRHYIITKKNILTDKLDIWRVSIEEYLREEELKGYHILHISMPSTTRMATDEEVQKLLTAFFDEMPTSNDIDTTRHEAAKTITLKIRTSTRLIGLG